MHKLLNNIKLRALVIVPLAIVFSTIMVFPSMGHTVNDVRLLLGRQEIKLDVLEEELDLLARKYLTAELNKAASEMFKMNEQILKGTEDQVKKIELTRLIEKKSDELYESFASNEVLDTVLEKRTELHTYISEASKLAEEGSKIETEFIPNRWSTEYIDAKAKVQELDLEFNIGDLGDELRSPVNNRFELSSPFGNRKDPIEEGVVAMHYGIDLNASEGDPILALWSGVVTNVFETPRYGLAVEIEHGKGLVTRYAHLSEQKVKIGDSVTQYDIIGDAGSTGRSTGPHLHLEIYLDDIIINPLMVFGEKSKDAYKVWASNHPDAIIDYSILDEIKGVGNGDSGEQVGSGFFEVIKKPDSGEESEGSAELPEGFERPEPGVVIR